MRGAALVGMSQDGGIDVTFTENGTYDLGVYGLVDADPIEFALLAAGGPAQDYTDEPGPQRQGGYGGGLFYGRARLYFSVRHYRLRITDDGCWLEGNNGIGGSTWTLLAVCAGRGGAWYDESGHWLRISATNRLGGLGGLNDVNNWERRGGGAAGFLSDGEDAPGVDTYTPDGKGGGGSNLNGGSSGALAGASANRNGLDFGGGAGVEFAGVGTRGRPLARIMAKSARTFPSGA